MNLANAVTSGLIVNSPAARCAALVLFGVLHGAPAALAGVLYTSPEFPIIARLRPEGGVIASYVTGTEDGEFVAFGDCATPFPASCLQRYHYSGTPIGSEEFVSLGRPDGLEYSTAGRLLAVWDADESRGTRIFAAEEGRFFDRFLNPLGRSFEFPLNGRVGGTMAAGYNGDVLIYQRRSTFVPPGDLDLPSVTFSLGDRSDRMTAPIVDLSGPSPRRTKVAAIDPFQYMLLYSRRPELGEFNDVELVGQRFDFAGNFLGPPVVLAPAWRSSDFAAGLGDGRVVVVSHHREIANNKFFGQILDASLTPVGLEFVLFEESADVVYYDTPDGLFADASTNDLAAAGGAFAMIIMRSPRIFHTSPVDLVARVSDADGNLLDDEFTIVAEVNLAGSGPRMGLDTLAPGHYVAHWGLVDFPGASNTARTFTYCGDGIVAGDEQCDDGNDLNGDSCTSTCQVSCGNGVIEPFEECDDGNQADADGCSSSCLEEECFNCFGQPSTCVPLSANSSCDDGNSCTINDRCNGPGGSCMGIPASDGTVCSGGDPCSASECFQGVCVNDRIECGPCKFCDGGFYTPGTCIPAPNSLCWMPVERFASTLLLRDIPLLPSQGLVWKMKKSLAFDKAAIGDMTDPNLSLKIEIYHEPQGDPVLLFSRQVPGGGTCDGKPCWKETKRGYKFNARKSSQNHPIDKIVLAGGESGKGKIIIKAIDPFLQLPPFAAVVPPVAVNVIVNAGQTSTGGWGAVFENDGVKTVKEKTFRAKGH